MAKYLDSDGLLYLWDKVKAYVASQVQAVGALTGVKGDAETAYRTGNVNLTAANVGAAPASHTHTASEVGAAAASHTHVAEDITGGVLSVARAVLSGSLEAASAALGGTLSSAGGKFRVSGIGTIRTDADTVYINNANNEATTYVQGGTDESGRQFTRLGQHRNVGGSDVYNNLNMLIDATGNRTVVFSSVTPWRAALGMGALALKDELDEADVPSLAASKIGSGTLASARLPTVPISKGGTGKTTRVDALDALGVAYVGGDTFSGTIHTAGYVTNSGKNYCFTIPIAKNIEGDLTLTTMTLTCRQDNKYVVGSASAGTNVKSVTTVTRTAHGLYVVCALASAPSNVTNNSAVGIVCAYAFSVATTA